MAEQVEVFTDPVRLAQTAQLFRRALERCAGPGCECRKNRDTEAAS